MAILLNNNGYDNESWKREFERQLPEHPVRFLQELTCLEEITYAMVWDHPKGDLRRYPNLKAVFSLGAGAEHFAADPNLPDAPIVLLADPNVARDMASHALYWVLDHHRKYARYRAQQKEKLWQRASLKATKDITVGITGLGRIGSEVAKTIAHAGYRVSGWDLFDKDLPNVEIFSGTDQFHAFLSANEIVINCLPLTPSTHEIFDHTAFAAMPKGAFFINISRGQIVNDAALLDALDTDALCSAALDAFAIEPLPASSPYWSHEKVTVTPHMAGATYASTAVELIVANVRRLENGTPPFPIFEKERGF